MAATTSGTKTVLKAASPGLPASLLTNLLASPVELLSVHQLAQLKDAINRVPGGNVGTALIGALLP